MKYLTKAALLIAYDNGAISRYTKEEDVLQKMISSATLQYSAQQLEEVEKFLASLSEEDIEELCTGEEGRVEAPELVSDVLNTMFDHC